MAQPFAGITDALHRAQPAPARVVLPDITSRLPAVATGVATIRSAITARLESLQGTTSTVKVPWQGFAHTVGQARAPHPHYAAGGDVVASPNLAFTQGFRDLRRNGGK